MLKFTIRELLLVTALAGTILGWVLDHRFLSEQCADLDRRYTWLNCRYGELAENCDEVD
jgi:hypothetical protein